MEKPYLITTKVNQNCHRNYHLIKQTPYPLKPWANVQTIAISHLPAAAEKNLCPALTIKENGLKDRQAKSLVKNQPGHLANAVDTSSKSPANLGKNRFHYAKLTSLALSR